MTHESAPIVQLMIDGHSFLAKKGELLIEVLYR